MQDRFPVGAGGDYSAGETGGSEDHQHSIDSALAEVDHSHTLSDGMTTVESGPGVPLPDATHVASMDLYHNHTGSTESHLPPFYGVVFIRKT